jgi:hypothetical protein
MSAPLPPPTGTHAVARTALEWTDPHRPERYGDNGMLAATTIEPAEMRRTTNALLLEFLRSPTSTTGGP